MSELSIHRLLADGRPSAESIANFLDRHTFPLIEDTSVTFIFRGEADAVLLQHFIFGLETSQPFKRIDSTDLWFLVIELPEQSTLQYKLNIIRGDEHRWIMDPRNDERALDPYGANSVVRTAGTERPEWTFPETETRPGDMVRVSLESQAFEEKRHVMLYLPARFRRTRRYPLLLVHDGRDYLRFSDLKTVLDNLIHRLEVAPMIVALTNSPARLDE